MHRHRTVGKISIPLLDLAKWYAQILAISESLCKLQQRRENFRSRQAAEPAGLYFWLVLTPANISESRKRKKRIHQIGYLLIDYMEGYAYLTGLESHVQGIAIKIVSPRGI